LPLGENALVEQLEGIASPAQGFEGAHVALIIMRR
jgi:hypothetical protein